MKKQTDFSYLVNVKETPTQQHEIQKKSSGYM